MILNVMNFNGFRRDGAPGIDQCMKGVGVLDATPANPDTTDADDLVTLGKAHTRCFGVKNNVLKICQMSQQLIFPFQNRTRQKKVKIVKFRFTLDKPV
jgi:hypothetical protein